MCCRQLLSSERILAEFTITRLRLCLAGAAQFRSQTFRSYTQYSPFNFLVPHYRSIRPGYLFQSVLSLPHTIHCTRFSYVRAPLSRETFAVPLPRLSVDDSLRLLDCLGACSESRKASRLVSYVLAAIASTNW